MLCVEIADVEAAPEDMSMVPTGRQACCSPDCAQLPGLQVRVRYGEGMATSCARWTTYEPTEDPEVFIMHRWVRLVESYVINFYKAGTPSAIKVGECTVTTTSTRSPEDPWGRVPEDCGEETSDSDLEDCVTPPDAEFSENTGFTSTYSVEVDESQSCAEAASRVEWGEWSDWVTYRLGSHKGSLSPMELAMSLGYPGYLQKMEVQIRAILKPMTITTHQWTLQDWDDAILGDPTTFTRQILLPEGEPVTMSPESPSCSEDGITYTFLRLLCAAEPHQTPAES